MKRKTWIIVGLVLIFVIGLAALFGESPDEVVDNRPLTSQEKAKASEPRLFADASGGIEQFIGGSTMPAGSYDFKCGRLGNVSVQLGRAPYTVSLKAGDQTRSVGSGDMVTVGMCKVYGPR